MTLNKFYAFVYLSQGDLALGKFDHVFGYVCDQCVDGPNILSQLHLFSPRALPALLTVVSVCDMLRDEQVEEDGQQ